MSVSRTSTIFTTDFTGATDPGLIPNPFTSITAPSSNTCIYNATTGKSSGPGMYVSFAGTSNNSFGEYDADWSVYPSNKIITMNFSINFGILPFVGVGASSTIGLCRLFGDDGVIVSVSLFKSSASNAVFRIVDTEHSTNTNGTTLISAATWYDMQLITDCTVGSESIVMKLNGVTEATKASPGTFTKRLGGIRAGGIGITGTPVAGVNWSMDNISIDVTRDVNYSNTSIRQLGSVGGSQFNVSGISF